MSNVTRTIMSDGSEIWHLGKFEDIVFCDEPINIFEELEPVKRTYKYDAERAKEWKSRCMNAAVKAIESRKK